jgi:hypothetical protein
MCRLDASAATTRPIRIDPTVVTHSPGVWKNFESRPVRMLGARPDKKVRQRVKECDVAQATWQLLLKVRWQGPVRSGFPLFLASAWEEQRVAPGRLGASRATHKLSDEHRSGGWPHH